MTENATVLVVAPLVNGEGKVTGWSVNGGEAFGSKAAAIASLPKSGASVKILKKDGTVQLEVKNVRGVRAPKAKKTTDVTTDVTTEVETVVVETPAEVTTEVTETVTDEAA